MPRRKKKTKERHVHGPTIHDRGFKVECYGCAFVGQGFVCMTSDGTCLKVKPAAKGVDDASAECGADSTGQER